MTVKAPVPIDKQTKRQRKAWHNRKRGSWGDVVPVTRVVPDGKAYRRQDARRAERRAMNREE